MESWSWIERNKLLLIVLIFFVGFLLRFYDLGSESFWLDEMVSLDYASQDLVFIFNPPVFETQVLPLYYVLLHFWIGLFGVSEFAIRSLSAVFGCFSILILYKLGKYLFNTRIAVYGSFLLSVSFFHLYFSQEARMYSLLTLITLVSVFFFLKSMKEKGWRFWVGFVGVSLLMLYTHFFGVFVLVFEFFYLLFYFREKGGNWKRGVLGFLVVGVGFLPWLFKFVELISHMVEGQVGVWWISNLDGVSVLATIVIFCNSSLGSLMVFGFSLKNLISFSKSKRSLIRSSFLEGIKRVKRRFLDSSRFSASFCFLWILIPVILCLLISFLVWPIWVARYLILVSPSFYLLVAKGLAKTKLKIQYILFLILIVDSALISYSFYTHFDKEQWNQAAIYVQEREEIGDLILVNAPWLESNFQHYYKGTNNITGVQSINQLNQTLQKMDPQRVWLILSHDWFADPLGKVKKILDNTYELNFENEFISQDLLNNISILGYPLNPQAYYKIEIHYYLSVVPLN